MHDARNTAVGIRIRVISTAAVLLVPFAAAGQTHDSGSNQSPPASIQNDSRPVAELSLAEVEGIALASNSAVQACENRLAEIQRQRSPSMTPATQSGVEAVQRTRRLEQELAAERARLRKNLRIAYFLVLNSQRQVASTQELMTVTGPGAEDVGTHSGTARGANPLAELLAEAKLRHRENWQRLATIIGRPGIEMRMLSGGEPTGNASESCNEVVERFLAQSPRCLAAQETVQQALVTLRSATPADTRLADTRSAALAKLVAAVRQAHRLECEALSRLRTDIQRLSDAEYEARIISLAILPNAEQELEFVSARVRDGQGGAVDLMVAQSACYRAHAAYVAALRELTAALEQFPKARLGTPAIP